MKLLVDKKEVKRLNFVIGMNEAGEYVFGKTKEEVKTSEFEEHWFEFRKIDYKDSVEIFNKSSTFSMADSDFKINPATLRYERFITLVTDWSFVDGDKVKIVVNRENIGKLVPVVATYMMDLMDSEL